MQHVDAGDGLVLFYYMLKFEKAAYGSWLASITQDAVLLVITCCSTAHPLSNPLDPLLHPHEPAGQGPPGKVVLNIQPEGAYTRCEGDHTSGAVTAAEAVQLCRLEEPEAGLQAICKPVLPVWG